MSLGIIGLTVLIVISTVTSTLSSFTSIYMFFVISQIYNQYILRIVAELFCRPFLQQNRFYKHIRESVL